MPSSFELWWNRTNDTPVLVLFILVWPLIVCDRTAFAKGGKEQVLAAAILRVAFGG